MHAAEAELSAVLQGREEEVVDKARARAALAASAGQFEQLRAAQCEVHAVLAAGGNAAGDRRLSCEIELDQRRTRDLAAIAASLR